MSERLNIMADMLLELEREMRRLELWSTEAPGEDALASTAPFSADRLSLEEWLQWIFIPTIKNLIETDQELPGKCEIFPYAEEYLRPNPDQPARLLKLIRAIDTHISG